MEGEAPEAPLGSFESATAAVPPREAERCGELESEVDTELLFPPPVSAPSPVSPLGREATQASAPLWAPEPGLRRLFLCQKRGASLLAAVEERMAEDLDVCLSGEQIQESLTPFSSPSRLVQEFLQQHFGAKEEEEVARRRRAPPVRCSSLSTREAGDPCSSSSLSPLSPLSPACSLTASFKRPLLPLLPVSLNLRTVFRRHFPPDFIARLQSGGEPRYQLLPPLQALCVSRGNEALLLACLAQESPCLRVGPLPGGDILSVHLSPAPVGFLFPAAAHLLFFLTPSILHVYAVVLLPAAPGQEDSCHARDLPAQTSVSGTSDHPVFRSAENGALPLFLPSYEQPDLSSPLSASASGRVCPTVRLRRGAIRLIRLESSALVFPESLRSRFSSAARAATGAASVQVSPFLSSTAEGAVFLSVPDNAPCDSSAAAPQSERRRRRRQPSLGDIYQLLLHPGPPGRLRAPARLRRLPLAVAGASGARCARCMQLRKHSGEDAIFETPPPHTRGEAGVKLLRCFPAGLLAVVDDRDAVYIYRLVSEGCRESLRRSLCGAAKREEETGVGRRGDTANREEDARGASAGTEAPRPQAAGHWLPAFLRSETFPHSAREEREDDVIDSEEETARQRWGVAGVLGSVSRKIRKLLSRETSPSPPLCSSRFPPPSVLPVSGLSFALAGSGASSGGEFHGDFLLGPQQTAADSSPTSAPCGLASVSREAYLEAVVNALGATPSQTGLWSPPGDRYGTESRDLVSSAVAFKGLECVAYLPAHVWRERLVLSPTAPTRAPENGGGAANAATKAEANREADGEAAQRETRSFLSSFWPSGQGAPRPTGVEGEGARCVATRDGTKEFSDANAACEDLLLSVVDIVPALTVGPYPTVSLITARGDRVALRLRPRSRGCAPCSQCGGADLSTQPLSLGVSSVLPSPFFSTVAYPRNRLGALPPALRPFCGDVASIGGGSVGTLPTKSHAPCSFYSNGLNLFAASPTLSRLFDVRDRDGSEEGASAPAFVSLRVSLPSASPSSSPFFLNACLPLQLPSAPLAACELPLFFASNDFSPSFCLPPTDGLSPGLDAAQLSSLDLSALGSGSGAGAGASSPTEGALVHRHLMIVCATEVLLVAVDRCRAVLSPSSAAPVEGASVLARPPSPRATAALDASWALETCTASGAAAAVAARTQALGAATAVLDAAESWVRAGPAGPRLERLARDLVQNGSVLAAALPPSLPAPVWSPTLWHCLCEVASQRGSADAALGLFFSLSAPRLWSLEEAPPPSSQPVFFLRRLHLASPPGASRQVSKSRVLARRRASERRQVDGGDREDDTSLGWWTEEDSEAREPRRGSKEELSREAVAPWVEGLAARAALLLRTIADWPICMVNPSILDPSVSGSLLSPSSPPTASALPPRLFPLCVRWNAAYLGTVYDALNDLLQFLYLQCLPTSSLSFVAALLASPLSPTALLRRPPSAEPRLEAVSEAAERARKALLAVLLPHALPEDASGDAREAAEGAARRVPASAEYSEQQSLLLGLTLSLLRARAIVYLFLVLQEFSPARQQHVWSLLLGETEGGRDSCLARLLVHTPLRALLSGDETLNEALPATTQSRGLREAAADGEGGEDFADEWFCRNVMHALLLLDPTPQRPGSVTRRLCASLPWLAATCNVELLLPRWWEAERRDGGSAATLASCRRLSLFVADIFAGFSGRCQTSFFVTAMEHFLASTPQPSPVVALHFALRLLYASLRHDSPPSLSSFSSSVACPDVIARAFGAALARGAAKAARESAGAEAARFSIFFARAWVEYLACILNYEIPDDAFFGDGAGDEQAALAPREQSCEREERKRAALQQLQWAALDELFGVYRLQLPPLPEAHTGGRCEQAGTEEETEREARSFGVFGPFRPPGNEFVVSALEWLVHHSLDSGVCTPESRVESPRDVSRSACALAPQSRFACGELDGGARADARLSPAALRTLQVYLHRRFFQNGRAAQGDVLLRLYRHQGARVESAAVLCALATRGAKQDLFRSEHGDWQAGETTKKETDSFSLLLPVTVKAQALRWARATLQEEIDLAAGHARRGPGLHAGAAGEESKKGDEGDTPRAQRHGQGKRHYTTEAILHLFGRLFRTAEEVAYLSRVGAEESGELESDSETRKTIQQLAVVRDAIGNLSEALEKLQLPLWRHLKNRLECQRARALLQTPPTACSFLAAEPEADLRAIPSYIMPPVSLSGVCTLGQQVETVPNLFHAAQMFFCVPLSLRALLFDFRRLVSLTSLSLLPPCPVSSSSSASCSSSPPFSGSISEEADSLGGQGEGEREASLCLELENSPQFPHLQQAAETVRNTAEALLFSFSARLVVAPDSFDSLTGTIDLSGSAADLLERGEASSLIEKVLAVCIYSWGGAAPARASAAASPLSLFPVSQAGNLELLCCLETVHALSCLLESGGGDQPSGFPLLVAERWLGLSGASAFQVYFELLSARDRLAASCEALRHGVARLLAEGRFSESQTDAADPSLSSVPTAVQVADVTPGVVETHLVSILVALAALWVDEEARESVREGRVAFGTEELHAPAVQALESFLRAVAEQRWAQLPRKRGETEEHEEEGTEGSMEEKGSELSAEALEKARETLAKLRALLACSEEV